MQLLLKSGTHIHDTRATKLTSTDNSTSVRNQSARRALRVLAIVVALAVPAFGPAALAAGWGPYTSTYNGNTVVDIRGNISMNGTIAKNVITLTDTRNDGNAVYAKGKWWKRLGGVWLFYGHENTGEIENTSSAYTWTKNGASHQQVIGCAQMGWPVPDSCTGWKWLVW